MNPLSRLWILCVDGSFNAAAGASRLIAERQTRVKENHLRLCGCASDERRNRTGELFVSLIGSWWLWRCDDFYVHRRSLKNHTLLNGTLLPDCPRRPRPVA